MKMKKSESTTIVTLTMTGMHHKTQLLKKATRLFEEFQETLRQFNRAKVKITRKMNPSAHSTRHIAPK